MGIGHLEYSAPFSKNFFVRKNFGRLKKNTPRQRKNFGRRKILGSMEKFWGLKKYDLFNGHYRENPYGYLHNHLTSISTMRNAVPYPRICIIISIRLTSFICAMHTKSQLRTQQNLPQ